MRHVMTCHHVHKNGDGLSESGYLRYRTLKLAANKCHGLSLYQRVFKDLELNHGPQYCPKYIVAGHFEALQCSCDAVGGSKQNLVK